MSKTLPYRADTSRGNQFEFDFALHPETVSAVNVANLLSAVLATLDREISTIGEVGNGDVLQSLAMALAVRTRMLPGDADQLATLTTDLLQAALASKVTAAAGNVPNDGNNAVH